MKLLSVLRRFSRPSVIGLAVFFGFASGAANAAILGLINRMVHNRELGRELIWVLGFVALAVGLLLARFASASILARISTDASYELRMELSRRILRAPLRKLEELGPHRLLVALTDDTGAISNALSSLPVLLISFAMILGCLVYLGWLSWQLLLVLLVFMVLGSLAYQVTALVGFRFQRKARQVQDGLFDLFHGLTEGHKELKMRWMRMRAYDELLSASAGDHRRYRYSAMKKFILAAAWGNLSFYVAIGLLLFVAVRWIDVDTETISGFVLVLVYLIGPFQFMLNSAPVLSRAHVSVQHVDGLGISLAGEEEPMPDTTLHKPGWKRLELRGVSHEYPSASEEEEPFRLGPVDLELEPGELLFLTGGNGSGKTTLGKVILGLYPPDEGEILFDGEPIDEPDLPAYRDNFSAVFYDFYLFDRLLGLESEEVDQRAHHYLEVLRLDHKVRVRDGRLSTTDLSQGQRKRLALLTAYLDDRPIFLFDEWAADQDPEFRETFYEHLLPELKRRGKGVVVITHDERYFHVADRIVKLDYGQVVPATSHAFTADEASA